MIADYEKLFSEADWKKLKGLENPKMEKVICEAIEHMTPDNCMFFDDSAEDTKRARQMSMENGEEMPLNLKGHTIHFDAPLDQARDKTSTQVLLPKGQKLSRDLNFIEREQGLEEILGYMKGIMKGKTMLICPFCLGPQNSIFSISALQITDSFYVIHSEMILYRQGYHQMKNLKNKDDFFYFWHSAGELDEQKRTKNINKRRIYIDPMEERVLSCNNQYAGNSLACKKLALRLAIHRANNSNWLTEHMFLTGIAPKSNPKRVTYFSGAFPSACGKTSTAMIPGTHIVGDDILYTKNIGGKMMAVNIERGIFGIISDVNAQDDPLIYKTLRGEREVIFSNVMYDENKKTFWQGCGEQIPEKGTNYMGEWYPGKKDAQGKEIPISHPNSRFTLRISELENCDTKNLDNPDGVHISGILYGGRDPNITVPCAECVSWSHGVVSGAMIESVPTAATLGNVSTTAVSSPMANLDFLIVPLGKYITNHLNFGKSLKEETKIFTTNYFLLNDKGKYANTKLDKMIWLHWFEGRIHKEFDAIKTPIGNIPKYEDLKNLFAEYFNGREYTKEEYVQQFSIRCDKYLEKYERMRKQYEQEEGMPKEFWVEMERLEKEMKELKEKHNGAAVVSPFDL